MSVLVTGGAGFIGQRLANTLARRGSQVRVFDNFDPLAHVDGSTHELIDEIEVIEADLRNRDAVDNALEGVTRVLHLGGVVGNGESMINIARAVANNSVGTANLLEAVIARRDTVERVVVASSMVVYGEGSYACEEHGRVDLPGRAPDQLAQGTWDCLCPQCAQPLEPVAAREDTPLRPTSVYGITKRDQEELALVLGRAYEIETVALRYLNVYGAGQALGNPYTGVAAIFAARALDGRTPLVFEDGRQIRDLVHVSDVVEATVRAMTAAGAPGRAINVATGRRMRIIEIAQAITAALDGPEPEVTGEYRAGDIRHCFADTSLARELLGFEASVAFEDGLPELVDWVARQTPATNRGDAALVQLRTAGLVS